jgi:hypothetical protein
MKIFGLKSLSSPRQILHPLGATALGERWPLQQPVSVAPYLLSSPCTALFSLTPHQNEKNEMGGACGAYGGGERGSQDVGGET